MSQNSYAADPEFAQKMFGGNPDKILANLAASGSYQRNGALSQVASILSDAQEVLEGGDQEKARQLMNVAKLVIFEVIDGNLFGVVSREAA